MGKRGKCPSVIKAVSKPLIFHISCLVLPGGSWILWDLLGHNVFLWYLLQAEPHICVPEGLFWAAQHLWAASLHCYCPKSSKQILSPLLSPFLVRKKALKTDAIICSLHGNKTVIFIEVYPTVTESSKILGRNSLSRALFHHLTGITTKKQSKYN